MRDLCSVPLCNSVKGKTQDVRFHEFPSTSTREMWIKNIARSTSHNSINPWEPNERSLVCSLHFDKSAYVDELKTGRLKKLAVSTLFEDFPSYLKPTLTSVKRKAPTLRVENTSKKLKSTVLVSVFAEFSSCLMDQEPPPFPVPRVSCLTEDYPTRTTDKDLPPLPSFRRKSVWGKTPSPSKVQRRLKLYSSQKSRLQREVNNLRKENSHLKNKLKKLENLGKTTRILQDAKEGSTKAIFLLEQLKCYGSKWHKWSEDLIKKSILWRAKSPHAYEHIRRSGILRLPCSATLRKYLGNVTMQCGITNLIKERIQQEFQNMNEMEVFCSLIFDEMSNAQSANIFAMKIDWLEIWTLVDF